MFDIGWSEMGVIALIALIVIGPKDLPKVMRSAAHWARKARGLAREFQSGVDDMIREADLEDARAAVESAKSLDVRKAITDTVDPTGDIRDEARDVEDTARKSGEIDDTDGKDEADTGTDTDGAPEPNIAPPHSLTPPQDSAKTTPSPEPVSPAAADDDTGKRAS
jgi:sec-independent protein translocase protein TatB